MGLFTPTIEKIIIYWRNSFYQYSLSYALKTHTQNVITACISSVICAPDMQLSNRNFSLATFCSIQMEKKKFWKDVCYFNCSPKGPARLRSSKMESFKSLAWKLEGEEGPGALLRCVYIEGLHSNWEGLQDLELDFSLEIEFEKQKSKCLYCGSVGDEGKVK